MRQPRATAHLMITVAALTRRRPEMVDRLIRSFGEMTVPEKCTVQCLIVENDTSPDTCELVTARNPLPNGMELAYVLEPEPGIPFARNRAAREALETGANLLAFVDDDEIVAPDWLARMVYGYRQGRAVLLGGPRRIAPYADGELTTLERVMHANLTANFADIEERAARTSTVNDTPKVTVFTNNWLGETTLFSGHDIWFDETMRFTGGTDSKFCAAVKAKNLPVGWVKDAFVYETVTRDRLSFAYQHERSRDQINNLFHQRMSKDPSAQYKMVIRLPVKAIEILVLAISVPLTRGRTLFKLAKTTGWVAGRVGAAFGRRSKLYETAKND
ncbi:MAG: glycosyltransferase [Pseudomonadota bacterium]